MGNLDKEIKGSVDLRKKSVSILEIKDNLRSLKGKMLDIRINKGRKKIVKCVGEVVDIYPAVFTMKIDGEQGGVTAYSYNDIICGTISLSKK